LPDTEAISPLTQALPLADAGDVVAEGDFALFDEPHAPTDTAVAPATARIANPVSRVGWKVRCIEILSIVGRFGQIS
jgi:hypothetical protein